ncbi:MAG: hypothetical protein JNL50_11990 [Phycisphaerae bacterium]|nr:hypothetical protein [Phycisphaerae bacterium]
MNTRRIVSTLLLAAATTASAKPPLTVIDTTTAAQVQPFRVATVSLVDGKFVAGDWWDYSGASTRAPVWCGWDAFGRDWGVGSNANAIYGNYCGMSSPGDRWFYGWGYNCPLFCDDMVNVSQPGALIDEINFSWTWEGTGNCDILVMLADVPVSCNHDPLTQTYYAGLIFSFGVLPGGPGTLYTSNFTGLVAAGFAPPLPPSNAGSYLVGIGDMSTGTFQTQPWPTQSLLWGSKSMMTPPYDTAPYIEGCGTHDYETWDDDAPADSTFNIFECYQTNFGLCPDPLNHMIAFGIAQPPCPPCSPSTVTKHYKIRGPANGTPWTWGIAETPFGGPLYAHGKNTGVSGSTCVLANALVNEINTYAAQDLCSPTNLQATVMSCGPFRARVRIVAQVCMGSSFELYTGNGNVDPTCLVPTWPAFGCQFNPEIVEIVPSGQDCNENGEDDMFDIADGVSNDVNNDGVPDECQCLADYNADGFVNGNDYDYFAALFDAGDQGADANADGFVNGNDYDLFAEHFDAGC